MDIPTLIGEQARKIPVAAEYDVIVCGGGPAGVAAALAAGRNGARTAIVEGQGCLGGVWTSGLLSIILEGKSKPGLMQEIRGRLRERGAIAAERDLYDAEAMKLVLEELCAEAGVSIWLHTRVAAVQAEGGRLRHVIVEAKDGRFALGGKSFVDATGDGDLAALAGCEYKLGRDSDGLMQPMSLIGLIAGVPKAVRETDHGKNRSASCLVKTEFLQMLREGGHEPSYALPSLFPLPNGLCALMANHEYECSALSARDVTEATLKARREIHATVEAMRRFSPEWRDVHLVATAAHIGVREGRRINGEYRVTAEDILHGARHADAVTRVHFPVDVHSVRKHEGGGYSSENIKNENGYDIPLRALIARDAENLMLAGRCISGDFHAHASYRVTGNAVATGEAAGVLAAVTAETGRAAREMEAEGVLRRLESLREAKGRKIAGY